MSRCIILECILRSYYIISNLLIPHPWTNPEIQISITDSLAKIALNSLKNFIDESSHILSSPDPKKWKGDFILWLSGAGKWGDGPQPPASSIPGVNRAHSGT